MGFLERGEEFLSITFSDVFSIGCGESDAWAVECSFWSTSLDSFGRVFWDVSVVWMLFFVGETEREKLSPLFVVVERCCWALEDSSCGAALLS